MCKFRAIVKKNENHHVQYWLTQEPIQDEKENAKKETDTIQLQNIWFKVIPIISFDAY